MKRIIIFILLAAMLFSLCACGKAAPADTQSEDEEAAVSTTAPDVDENVTESVDDTVEDNVGEGGDDSTEADGDGDSEPDESGVVIQTAILHRK